MTAVTNLHIMHAYSALSAYFPTYASSPKVRLNMLVIKGQFIQVLIRLSVSDMGRQQSDLGLIDI